jgi:hypothetical protein
MRLLWCLTLVLLAMPPLGAAQDCSAQTTYQNEMCFCINEVRLASYPSGPPAGTFGFKDGQIDCGSDLNPCTIGHVDNCVVIQGQKTSPTPNGKTKIVVVATSDMSLMDSLVPFCGHASTTKRRELALVDKLKLP